MWGIQQVNPPKLVTLPQNKRELALLVHARHLEPCKSEKEVLNDFTFSRTIHELYSAKTEEQRLIVYDAAG